MKATHLPVNADRLVTEGERFVSEGAVCGSGAGAVVVKIAVLSWQNLPLLHHNFTLKMSRLQSSAGSDEISR